MPFTILFFFALGVYQLQLFADVHQTYADNYLHHVDSDNILICECYHVAHGVAEKFDSGEQFSTPKADKFCDSLYLDEFSNAIGEIKLDGNTHSFTLNKRVTQRQTLEAIKSDLLKTKKEILKCLSDNIKDQNGEDSLAAMFSAFDLESKEDIDGRLSKISSLYEIYGHDTSQCERGMESPLVSIDYYTYTTIF